MTKPRAVKKRTMPVLQDGTSATAPGREAATTARLSQIVANPDNPRGQIGDVSDLVAGFEADGQIQPITVVEAMPYLQACPEAADVVGDAVYVAITGARRIAAAQQLGWTTLDVVVKNEYAESRGRAFMAAFLENFQREEVQPAKIAGAVRRFVDDFRVPKGDVAAKFGKSNAWVTREYRIGGLGPELLAEYDSGRLTKEDADEIGKRKDPQQQAEAWAVIRAAREVGDKRKADDVLKGPQPAPEPEPEISRREIPEDNSVESSSNGSGISRREIDGASDTTTMIDTTVATEFEPASETVVSNGHDTNGSGPKRVQPYREKKAEPADTAGNQSHPSAVDSLVDTLEQLPAGDDTVSTVATAVRRSLSEDDVAALAKRLTEESSDQ